MYCDVLDEPHELLVRSDGFFALLAHVERLTSVGKGVGLVLALGEFAHKRPERFRSLIVQLGLVDVCSVSGAGQQK